jgi:hypothetical protein
MIKTSILERFPKVLHYIHKLIIIDYIDLQQKNSWRLERRRRWSHLIGLDSLFQKIPAITKKKRKDHEMNR